MMTVTRRRLIQSTGAMAALTSMPFPVNGSSAREISLRAEPATAHLVGKSHPQTAVWAYNGQVPGPEIRIRRGEGLRVTLENALAESTTVHWHGVRLPNAMDGVPGLTQPPVQPGETFVYEFTPPDAGTFWYHSHVRSFEQVDRGLAGALIVEETKPLPVDRDVTWVLDDWRLDREAKIAENFGVGHDLSHAGRVGNTVTINGRILQRFDVRSGERIRLRLINAANARNFSLEFEGLSPLIVAIDGQPVQPHEPHKGLVTLGSAMRIDVVLDCTSDGSSPKRVIDRFYLRNNYLLTELNYSGSIDSPRTAPAAWARVENTLIDPNLTQAERHVIELSGGAMGRMRGAELDGKWVDVRSLMRQGLIWAMGGTSRRPGATVLPVIDAKLGSDHIVSLENQTAFPHPMHLHGHHFRVLSRNGVETKYKPWQDTVLVMPRETVDVAFKADNPGDWLFHCHVLEHHVAGMSALVRVS